MNITTRFMLDGMLGEYPGNLLGAKFNVPYAVAAALVTGSAGVPAFQTETIADPRIREMSSKVHVEVDPAIPLDGPQATARISLRDGRVLESSTTVVRGDYGNRVPRSQLLDKFHHLSDHVLGSDQAGRVIRNVERLDDIEDVRELTTLLGG